MPEPKDVLSQVDAALTQMEERITASSKALLEELRKHSIHIMRLNAARAAQKTAPAEVISARAIAVREHEQVCEKFLGEHIESWMAYYETVGIPAEPAPGELPTSPKQWVKPNVKMGG